MATMTVMFEVDVAHSGDVMKALAPHMGVLKNFQMEGGAQRVHAPKKPKRARTSRTEPIVMTALQSAKHVPYETVKDALEEAGYARTSASPILSRLRSEGKVAYNREDDTWSLTDGES